jgi:hypothetical protein
MLSRGSHPAWAKRHHERFPFATRWQIVKIRRAQGQAWHHYPWREWWEDVLYLVRG